MTANDSVSRWIEELKAGDEEAAEKLWNRYFARLVKLAYTKLARSKRRMADEEDIAVSVFKSFCLRARQDRFPDLRDQDGLWPLLVKITERKVVNHLRREGALKRGGGKVQEESALSHSQASEGRPGIDQIVSPDPTPEFASILAEAFQRLLRLLDGGLRQIAILKFEGYTNEEVADRIDRSIPTVERRLKLIRATWRQEDKP